MIKPALYIITWFLFIYGTFIGDMRPHLDYFTIDCVKGLWYISYMISSALLVRLDKEKECYYYVNAEI